jgi:hypothetical protein
MIFERHSHEGGILFKQQLFQYRFEKEYAVTKTTLVFCKLIVVSYVRVGLTIVGYQYTRSMDG